MDPLLIGHLHQAGLDELPMGANAQMDIVVSGDADAAQRTIDALVGIRDHEYILAL